MGATPAGINVMKGVVKPEVEGIVLEDRAVLATGEEGWRGIECLAQLIKADLY